MIEEAKKMNTHKLPLPASIQRGKGRMDHDRSLSTSINNLLQQFLPFPLVRGRYSVCVDLF